MKIGIVNLRIAAITAMTGLVFAFASCVKKAPPVPADPIPEGAGKVKLEFGNKVGTSNLVLGNEWYTNANGDSFKVNIFNYYISNIKLNGSAGTFAETESYHLIKQSDPSSLSFDLSDVPAGTYNSITLMIGVDSARNVSGAQTGALDPANEMYWSWKTGYIMFKLEGVSPQSTAVDNILMFHAGGFSGILASQRTVTLNFPTPIAVSSAVVNHVHIDANIKTLFSTPMAFDFSQFNVVSNVGHEAHLLANNYANMLSVSYSGL